MKFFEELGNKILWFILGILFLSLGYVFIVRNLLNPPKITTIPSIQPNSNSNPTKSQTVPTTPQTNPTDWQPTLEQQPTQSSQQVSQLRELARPTERVISVPKKLKRGAIISIYENEIDETNPEPHLYQPKLVVETPDFRLAGWYNSEFQEVNGYFYVPEDGTYNFVVTQVNKINKYGRDRILLALSVDGNTFPSREGGALDLQAGWHHINLYFNPKPNSSDSSIYFTQVNVLWSQPGQPLKPIVVYREFKENTQVSQSNENLPGQTK